MVLLIVCAVVAYTKANYATKVYVSKIKLMVGNFDLYSAEDLTHLNDLGNHLYGVWLSVLRHHGYTPNGEHELEHFYRVFFHGYITGRRDFTTLHTDPNVVEDFKRRCLSELHKF